MKKVAAFVVLLVFLGNLTFVTAEPTALKPTRVIIVDENSPDEVYASLSADLKKIVRPVTKKSWSCFKIV
jgi:hypothetical protein